MPTLMMLMALTLFSAPSYGLERVQEDNEKFIFGKLITFDYRGKDAAVIVPKKPIDKTRRWVWFSPGTLAFSGERVQCTWYVEMLLASGFHVAGFDLGAATITAASPAGAKVHYEFYQLVTQEFNLNLKARLVGQSNGGLNQYGWAFRHPECVDRILGMLAVTDFRTWPGMDSLVSTIAGGYTYSGLEYNMTLVELLDHIKELNPIDNLAPLAKAGVKLYHLHGSNDGTVPPQANTHELERRYRALGGEITIEIGNGMGHGTPHPFYNENQRALRFLIGD
jgi:hypothetical protein